MGSRPHTGPAEIGRFYDTFIGPRDIGFHRDLDIVWGSSVIRDLDLEVAMGSAVTMTIPAFLRYDLRQVEGDWKIAVLRAYWELPAMVLQFLGNGAIGAAGRRPTLAGADAQSAPARYRRFRGRLPSRGFTAEDIGRHVRQRRGPR